MNISIPSRGRAHRIGTVLKQFPKDVLGEIYIYVPKSQCYQYAQNLTDFPKVQLRERPEELKIAGTRDFMGKAAMAAGDEYFLMVDDDVRFECRVSETATNTRQCDPDDVRQMLVMIEGCFRDGR